MYVFSGTGNSLKAAQWIGDEARRVDVKSRITLLTHQTQPKCHCGVDEKLLQGFLYSTHGFSAPWTMLKFIASFPRCRGRNVDVFLLNTRGGTKLGPLFLPGISGIALLLPALILLWKGYRIVGTRPLDMPSSWHQLHPAFKESTTKAIIERRHGQVEPFAQTLLHGDCAHHGWWTLPLDLSLVPFTIFYFTIGCYGLAKLQLASRSCNGCRLCEQLCPVGAIELRNGRPYWTYKCESCMRCYSVCPKRAVQTAHVASALATIPLILLVPAIHHALWGIVEVFSPSLHPLGWILYGAAWATLTILATNGLYVVMYYAQRIKVIDLLLHYTFVTRLFRRHLAPGIKVKDLQGPEKEKKQEQRNYVRTKPRAEAPMATNER